MISQAAHRGLIRASLGLAILAVLVTAGGMAVDLPEMIGIALAMLVASLLALASSLLERLVCQMIGRPTAFDRAYSILAPPREGCHACGYAMHGVKGVFCPECGVVRPADSPGSTRSAEQSNP